MSVQFEASSYKNRWIAVVRNRVAGVGHNAEQAYHAAKNTRAKDRPVIYFVDASAIAHRQPAQFDVWFQHSRLTEIMAALDYLDQEIYLVGGAVRDGLLGRADLDADLDLIVPEGALEISKELANRLGVAYYPVDAERQVGRLVWPDQTHIDIATFRGGSLLADLGLRDFTINAIALQLDAAAPKLLDPLSGQADMAQAVIRATNEFALRDDPLRTLRAVRFAARFGFTITPQTQAWVKAYAAGLNRVSVERLRDEMLKLLQADQPGQAIGQLKALDVLPHLIPSVVDMVGVEQSAPHYLPVFEHTLRVMDNVPLLVFQDEDALTNAGLDFLAPIRSELEAYFQYELPGNLSRLSLMPLAALLHDIGKPHTFSRGSDGRIRFWNHPQVGAEIGQRLMEDWHFSSQATRFVTVLVRHHMRPLLLSHQRSVSRRAIHRFLVATAEAAPAIAVFALLDHLGIYAPGTGQAEWQRLTEVVLRVCQAYFRPKPEPLLSGHDIMVHLEISAGPMVGRILRELKEAQATGQVNDQAEALIFVEQLGGRLKEKDNIANSRKNR